jgi:hypothetical protein
MALPRALIKQHKKIDIDDLKHTINPAVCRCAHRNSIGNFLCAVRNGSDKRLEERCGSQPALIANIDSPAATLCQTG